MKPTKLRLFAGLAGSAIFLISCAESPDSVRAETLPLKPCRVAFVDNEVKCGTLNVVENRSTQQGRTIGINIVVLPAIARIKEPDPIFLFAGGPGQAATELAREALAILGGLNGKRDLVLIDQRGTGKSNGLYCKFPEDASTDMADAAKRDALSSKAVLACRKKLELVADLTQYTTTIAMADIEAVRAALGYERINLWGASYGTRAAMEYLRRYEARVRSVVIDGVAPPSLALPESFARDASAALEKMYAACAKDVHCSKRYSVLKTGVDELLANHAKQSRNVTVADAVTGLKREIHISRDTLLTVIFSSLYLPEMVAMLPAAIAEAKLGDYSSLAAMSAMAGESAEEKIAMGMRFSVVCAEDMPRIKRGPSAVLQATQPQPFGPMFVDLFAKGCENWPIGQMASSFDQPVKSSRPVLILSGALDPVTPPQYGEEVRQNFPNSLHAIAPNVGHGVSHRGCGPKLVKKFVETASIADLDAKCFERLPRPMFFEPMRERRKKDADGQRAQKDETRK